MNDRQQHYTICAILVFLLFIPLSSVAQDETENLVRISTSEEIKSEFESVPCKDKDRLKAVKALFEKMGAQPDEIKIEKFRDVENLMISKPGVETANEKIVIGAHYDKTVDGCGAIDNWTGIVAIAHAYRSLKDAQLKKTVIFVAFGKEEKGLIGSTAMVNAIKKEQLAEYCVMINIDSLGIAIPQVAENMSTRKLVELAAGLAKEMNMPFAHSNIPGADSDSSSFIRKKIPALTIHGLSNDWRKTLHSSNDQSAKIKPESVYLGYRLALSLIARINESPCETFRENEKVK